MGRFTRSNCSWRARGPHETAFGSFGRIRPSCGFGLPGRSSRQQPACARWASARQPSLASRAKAGGGRRTRTFEVVRRLIYSQPPITERTWSSVDVSLTGLGSVTQARIDSETPSFVAIAAVAPGVLFSDLDIFLTPALSFAILLNCFTSALVHSRRTIFFLALAILAPVFDSGPCEARQWQSHDLTGAHSQSNCNQMKHSRINVGNSKRSPKVSNSLISVLTLVDYRLQDCKEKAD